MIERLAEHIPGMLLLTATQEPLGQQSYFARLRLLNASRFQDYHTYIAEQAHQTLLTLLMNRHGTSRRVLFRNTRNGVKGFSHRHPI